MPFLVVVAALLVIAIVDRQSVENGAFNQQWLTNLLFVDILALIYHLWAVFNSYVLASRGQPRTDRRKTTARKWAATFGVLVIVSGTVVFQHAALASVDMGWQHDLSCWSALTPCFASSDTLAPGQTIAMDSNDPDDQQLATDTPDDTGPVPSNSPSFDSNATFDISALPSIATTPDSVNWAADGQLNVLLVGVDAGLGGGRSTGLRPDTMIVLHVDIASGRAALIGIPRNTMCVPLPQQIAVHYSSSVNGCPAYTWPYMLNWLANDAGWNHPSYYPFFQGSGLEYTRAMTATQEAIGTLTGLTIDGFVVINLMGLVNLIDDVGGINITVPTTVADYPCGPKGTFQSKWRVCDLNPGAPAGSSSKVHYGYEVPEDSPTVIAHMIADAAQSGGKQSISWSSGADIAFTIKAGAQHMDGDWALAYARTRIYSSDYDRMMRQQLVLKSMRNTLDPCTLLPQIPSLVNNLGTAFWTNMPLGDASQWAGMAKYIVGANVKSITLDPKTLGTNTTYINATSWATIKNLVAHSLDNVPPVSASGGGGGSGFSC